MLAFFKTGTTQLNIFLLLSFNLSKIICHCKKLITTKIIYGIKKLRGPIGVIIKSGPTKIKNVSHKKISFCCVFIFFRQTENENTKSEIIAINDSKDSP